MNAHKRQDRRKNYFIKKEFQVKFILRFCLLVALTALISAFAIYRFSSQSVTTVFENSRLIIKPSAEFIMPGLILSFLISVALVGIATVMVVLFISHRIAGPLYKVEASLDRIASGDLGFEIQFRRGDEIRKLADVFNTTSRSLDSLVKDVKSEYGRLSSAISELDALIERSSGGEKAVFKEGIGKIKTAGGRIDTKLNKFRSR